MQLYLYHFLIILWKVGLNDDEEVFAKGIIRARMSNVEHPATT
jgi:hypothetical protein